jgi:hypothetical protein
MMALRKSNWKFVTSNGGSLSIGLLSGEGGSVTLEEPGTRKQVKFCYGAFGGGLGVGVKLPKLGRVQLPGLVGSSESLTSLGAVYMTPQFPGSELTIENINGGCCFA